MSKQIRVPFIAPMISAILCGKKICTSRTKKYAEVGDWFEIHRRKFVIVDVIKLPLSTVSSEYYVQEGTSSPEDFISLWNHIHPMKGYNPEQLVFTHFFKLKS